MKGGDLSTADWGCLASGQWRKRIRGVYTRRFAIQIEDLYLFLHKWTHTCLI